MNVWRKEEHSENIIIFFLAAAFINSFAFLAPYPFSHFFPSFVLLISTMSTVGDTALSAGDIVIIVAYFAFVIFVGLWVSNYTCVYVSYFVDIRYGIYKCLISLFTYLNHMAQDSKKRLWHLKSFGCLCSLPQPEALYVSKFFISSAIWFKCVTSDT